MTEDKTDHSSRIMISYAQNFEDVLLDRIFRTQGTGFYIDVGVWDATKHSVTKHFYDMGWSGVNVEPLAINHERISEARPRDINLNLAVSSQSGPLVFFEVRDTGLSTARPDYAVEHVSAGHVVSEISVPTISLENIFQTHTLGRTVDFLKIDVEGAEGDVIRSGNWAKFRPRVLLVEATIPTSAIESFSAWEPGLLRCGYEFCYFDGLNRWYIRREEPELRRHFAAPPNVFDQFIPARVRELEDEVELLHSRLKSAMKKADRLDELSRGILGKIALRLA